MLYHLMILHKIYILMLVHPVPNNNDQLMFTFILKLYLVVIKCNKHFFNYCLFLCGELPFSVLQALASWTITWFEAYSV